MKRFFTLLMVALFAGTGAYAQKIYSTGHDYQADVKVYVVDHEYQADLLVYPEDHDYQAKGNEGRWYFVDHEYQPGWRNKRLPIRMILLKRQCR